MKNHDDPTRRLLACLGNPSRFKVIAMLLPGECCVSEIAGRIGLSQSCTTRHLQVLQREGLVRGVRRGKRVLFELRHDQPRVSELIRWAVSRAESEQAVEDPTSRSLEGADLHREGSNGYPGANPGVTGRVRQGATRATEAGWAEDPDSATRTGMAKSSPAKPIPSAPRPTDDRPAASGPAENENRERGTDLEDFLL